MSLESNSLIWYELFCRFVLNSSMMEFDGGGGFITRVISCSTGHGYEEDDWSGQAI